MASVPYQQVSADQGRYDGHVARQLPESVEGTLWRGTSSSRSRPPSSPARPPASAWSDALDAEFFAPARAASLLQRMIEPEEIASLVACLASPLSAATNGAALRVDGGLVPTIA